MNLQGRDLSMQMHGEDVGLLQTELQKLGYSLPSQETDQNYFGDQTYKAVREFQQKHNMQPTGVVDKETARLINEAVDAWAFVVQGAARLQDGTPFQGARVRATDKDLRREEPLGESVTDAQGWYSIRYTADQFSRAEKKSADLVVRAYTPNGELLGESGILFNARRQETVDLVVRRPQEVRLSEYEQLLAALEPVLQGLPPAELTEEDIAFLLKELADEPVVNGRRLRILAQGARLAPDTSLPTEFFYGVARQLRLSLPLSLDAFLTLEPAAIRQAVVRAARRRIVPATLRTSLDGILARLEHLKLERGLLVQREVVGRLIKARDNETEPVEPLAGFTVRAVDLDVDPEPRELGYDISNKRGLFTFVYTGPAKPPGAEEAPARRFRLQIEAPQGGEIYQTEIEVKADQQKVVDILVPADRLPQPPVHPLDELATTLNLEVPDALRAFLAGRNIRTLEEIRKEGGLRQLFRRLQQENANPPVDPDHPAVTMLDAHANLGILSSDIKVNQALIDKGFASITEITSRPRAEFVAQIHDAEIEDGKRIGDFKAAQLHEMAKSQVNFLNNLLMGLKADFANGLSTMLPGITNPRLPDWFKRTCRCADCESAVSPSAYLADLLQYALSHLRHRRSPITLEFLSDTFHQPFRDLPASCESVETPIRQMRICIEVLRSYLGSRPLDGSEHSIRENALRRAEQRYRIAAYTALLNRIGTSYEEIRLARSADDETRKALADRLGIDLDMVRPDHLDTLFLDPAAEPEAITEEALERIFGLRDATRAPLTNPPVPDLQTWRLQHLRTLWQQQDWPAGPYTEGIPPEIVEELGYDYYPRPIIDPDLISPDDLRPPLAGQPAFDLWQTRRDEVDGILANLQAAREAQSNPTAGLEEILKQVLGDPLPDLGALLTSLTQGTDPENTKNEIKNLKLTVESFTRLMEIKAKVDARQQLEDGEWDEVYAILTQAEKVKQFPDWITEEQAQGIILGPKQFWIALEEPELRKWLVTAEARQQWQQALRQRSSQPIIDPDLIGPHDLKTPLDSNSAYAIWRERDRWIDDQLTRLRGSREGIDSDAGRQLEWFNETIQDVPGVPADELENLERQREQGNDIRPRVEQLSLDMAAFSLLRRIQRLLSAVPPAPVLRSEWDDLDSILVQVQKRRSFAEWRAQERGGNIILSPDHFEIPAPSIEFPPPEPEPLPAWRATWRDRRDWEDTLESRIEQQQAVIESLREAVSAAEGGTLSMMRNALIAATGKSARELTKGLLIDCEMDACQMTTRVAQAIETIQGLLRGIRTGQLTGTHPTLGLDAEDFDAEWEWLGSYATWRAAMFVLMYPENILLPHLRRWQTPGFKNLVRELRENHRLTPEAACMAADRYAEYIRDVSDLILEAAVYASTTVSEGDCRARTFRLPRNLVYMFARGGETNTIYVSWYEPGNEKPDAQSFWEAAPGFEEVKVIGIVGAVPYAGSNEERSIYLFVRAREEGAQKLLYTKFDLHQGRWSGETQELELPEDTTEFTAVVKQRNWEDEPPHLAIRLPNGSIHARRMNRDGSGWEGDDWQWLIGRSKGGQFRELYAMLGLNRDEFYLFASDSSGELRLPEFPLVSRRWLLSHLHPFLRYRLFGDTDDGIWRSLDENPLLIASAWVGGFALSSTDNVYAFSKGIFDFEYTRYQLIRRSATIDHHPINTFSEFNLWLETVTGVSLERLAAGGTATPNFLEFLELEPDNPREYKELAQQLIGDLAEKLETREEPEWKEWKLADEWVRRHTEQSLSLRVALELLLEAKMWSSRAGPASPLPPQLRVKRREDERSLLGRQFGLERIVHASGASSGHVACHRSGPQVGVYRSAYTEDDTGGISESSLPIRVAPLLTQPFALTEYLPSEYLQERRERIRGEFDDNIEAPSSVLTYLEEAWYFAPMHIALQLQRRGQFTAALDWLRTVYDYSHSPTEQRNIYHPLRLGYDRATGFERGDDWLLDPLNPHAVAATRGAAVIPTSAPDYARFTIISIVRCLLAYADAEFTHDTPESNPRARTLYMTALDLLDLPELKQLAGACEGLVGELDLERVEPEWRVRFRDLQRRLSGVQHVDTLRALVEEISGMLGLDEPIGERYARIVGRVDDTLAQQPWPRTYGTILEERPARLQEAYAALLAHDGIVAAVEQIGALTASDVASALVAAAGRRIDGGGVPSDLVDGEFPWLRMSLGGGSPISGEMPLPTPSDGLGIEDSPRLREDVLRELARVRPDIVFAIGREIPFPPVPAPWHDPFCVPPNPLLRALRLHAELNLYKLRNCLNIAGMERQLELYGAPTDVQSGLPAIGEAGQLLVPVTGAPLPTLYRYEYLIERAKHLADRAAQMEAAFLAALEKRDAEYYNLMKARQDIRLARANVRLQDLRIQEAEDGVTLAELQRERAQIETSHYEEWLDAGTSLYETLALEMLKVSLVVPDSISLGRFGVPQVSYSPSGKFQTLANIFSIMADRERRRSELLLRRDLAMQDVRIGGQQIRLARDRVRIVSQERAISQMQADFAEDTANFLANKFTNVELYDWMSGILEAVYSFFLEDATAVSKLAESQLAFERQEVPPAIIQADYWEAPSDDLLASGPDGTGPERRGLTGSARLLADIYRLDQYRLETERRKLQLTKTISLARLAPAEFQRFRETGAMPFHTSLDMFDRDFPGHWLRLIRRVRTSVIALIPPTAGIHATLSTTGLSRVVIGNGGIFQTIEVRRPPETVALSSPSDATGLFELQPQEQEMLLPFEGGGVDTAWEFRIPKASNLFDYSTIADVLITIEYTALDSFDYRQQVIRELDGRISAERPFSFRQEFADQWYDLRNPEQTATPMVVRFRTRREDFPPNIEELRIQHVVLYFARADGEADEIAVEHLHFTEQDGVGPVGGRASSIDGVISTRRGNAGSWIPMIGKSPIGEWELALPNTDVMRSWFKDEEIEDILFVVTYRGRAPEWSA